MNPYVNLARGVMTLFCTLSLTGCTNLCDLRDPHTGQTIPSQFTGTAGTVRRTHAASSIATLMRVETISCGGFDRVVFEFDSAVPSYTAEYIDKPIRDCGQGKVIPVAGDAWLSIHFTSAQAHDMDTGQPTVTERNRMLNYPSLRQLVDVCDFEGNVEWVLGLGNPGRFRITELPNPPRVVVDVKH